MKQLKILSCLRYKTPLNELCVIAKQYLSSTNLSFDSLLTKYNEAVKNNENDRTYADNNNSHELKEWLSAPTVYCDGAYDWNRGKAGIGVFWGPADSRNLNLSLTGDKVTNIRAEIQAVNIAILQAHRSKLNRIYVKTDCAFVVKVINLWLDKWRLNSWKKASGAVVENVEDIKRLSDRLNLVKVRIEHIYGHQKVDLKKLMANKDQIAWRKLTSEERDALGNHESDRLAQLGIDQPMMSDTDFESLIDTVESAS